MDDEPATRANVHVPVERDSVHVARADGTLNEFCTLVQRADRPRTKERDACLRIVHREVIPGRLTAPGLVD